MLEKSIKKGIYLIDFFKYGEMIKIKECLAKFP